jgi:prepilin-type N-terminal cleavage/methylation domain-containing protein
MTSRKGFTLIEVLATMVLLALVLPAAMRGATIALSAASSARHRTEAATLAQAKLNELIATGQWNAGQSGDFADKNHPEYHWSAQSSSRDYGVFEVVVNLTWNENGAERKFALTTMAYDTTSAQSTTGVTP